MAPPFVPPPKLRRRPALVAGAVVAICLGALLAGWAWTASTNTQEVLAARHSIPRGAVIEAGDLARVRISTDPALSPLPASEFDDVVGRRAALDIGAGGLLTSDATTTTGVPASGMSVVGLAVTSAAGSRPRSPGWRSCADRRDACARRGPGGRSTGVQRSGGRRRPPWRGNRPARGRPPCSARRGHGPGGAYRHGQCRARPRLAGEVIAWR